jgi:hypothetical protein
MIEFPKQILTLEEILEEYRLTQILPLLNTFGIKTSDDLLVGNNKDHIDSVRNTLKLLPKRRFDLLLLDLKRKIIYMTTEKVHDSHNKPEDVEEDVEDNDYDDIWRSTMSKLDDDHLFEELKLIRNQIEHINTFILDWNGYKKWNIQNSKRRYHEQYRWLIGFIRSKHDKGGIPTEAPVHSEYTPPQIIESSEEGVCDRDTRPPLHSTHVQEGKSTPTQTTKSRKKQNVQFKPVTDICL